MLNPVSNRTFRAKRRDKKPTASVPPSKTTPQSSYIDEVKLFVDGGCRGNPGPGAVGILILGPSNNELETYSKCIGQTTNNRAEYTALIEGLDRCAKYTRRRVTCFSDCLILINQMNGVYRLKDDTLRSLFKEVKRLECMFEAVVYQHTNRTNQYIKQADHLLNNAFEGR